MNILVIGKDGGSLEKAEKIEKFYGQETTALSGEELNKTKGNITNRKSSEHRL